MVDYDGGREKEIRVRFRLVALDLTGTLLEEDGGLDPLAVELIGRAADQAMRFVLATNLPPAAAASVARRLDVAAHIIAGWGAVTVAPPAREALAPPPLDPGACRAALERAAGRVEARLLGFPGRTLADLGVGSGEPAPRLPSWLLTATRPVDDLLAELGPT